MALVSIPGPSLWFPREPIIQLANTASATLTIDATGEKIAMIGFFFSPDRTSKTINKVGFPTGAITSAGGSVIRVSLQNVSTTAGAPSQPDGTQDQYRDANLNTYTANSWFDTGLITSDGTDTGSKRTVSPSELLAVVIEYDSGGRLGADSLVVNTIGINSNTYGLGGGCTLFTASWANQALAPPVIFECSDGSFASLLLSFPFKSRTTTSYHVNSTPDEYGLKFIAPFNATADGLWAGVAFSGGGSDGDLVLYEDGTEVASVSIDANTPHLSLLRPVAAAFSSAVSIGKGREYIISLRPTTTNTVTVVQYDVNSDSHWSVHPGPAASCQTTRANAGSWSDTTTRRIMAGLLLSEIHDGDVSNNSIAWVTA